MDEIIEAMDMLAIPEKAEFFPRFFKAGPGQYAEGDQFIGVSVPDQRRIANEFWNKLSLSELEKLLSSPIHEHRHCALLILVKKFEKSKTVNEQTEIVDFYLNNKKYINNWDLVDNSAYKILGKYCYEHDQLKILHQLAAEENLWSKRIAIVATMFYIKKGIFEPTLELALQNLEHPHDLMHKANGWLLREMGQKNENILIDFLQKNYPKMPRTTLRYAIEKFSPLQRQDFLKGNFG